MARRRGVEAVTAAMDTGEPVIALVRIDGIARAALTAAEFAAITGQTVTAIRREINEGRIRAIRGGHGRPASIPTGELAEWQARADYLDPTA